MNVKETPFDAVAQQFTPMIHQQLRLLHIYKEKEHYFQMGLIGLWEAIERYDEEKGTFLSFAYMTVRGKILSELRKEMTFYSRHDFSSEELLSMISDPNQVTPLADELIQESLQLLNPHEQLWLTKAVVEGKTPTTIAKELGRPVDQVKYWRKQAIKKLKESWNRGDGSRDSRHKT